jgi:hypothetical protein
MFDADSNQVYGRVVSRSMLALRYPVSLRASNHVLEWLRVSSYIRPLARCKRTKLQSRLAQRLLRWLHVVQTLHLFDSAVPSSVPKLHTTSHIALGLQINIWHLCESCPPALKAYLDFEGSVHTMAPCLRLYIGLDSGHQQDDRVADSQAGHSHERRQKEGSFEIGEEVYALCEGKKKSASTRSRERAARKHK